MKHPERKRRTRWLPMISGLLILCCCAVAWAGLPDQLNLAEPRFNKPDSADVRQYLGLSDRYDFALSEVGAKYMLIGYFALKCPGCHKQAPVVEKVFQKIQQDQELSADLRVLAVIVGSGPTSAAEYATKFKLTYPVFGDPFFVLHRQLGDPHVPVTMVVRNDGKILLATEGAVEDLDEFMGKIKKAVRGK